MGERADDQVTPLDTRLRSESAADEPAGAEAAQIKAEIEQTRADLGDTLDAIQDRLTPRHMLDHAKEAVKDATRDRVRGITQQAGAAASNVADITRDTVEVVAERLRRNPMPAALGSLGFGLLFALRQRSLRKRKRAYRGQSERRTDSRQSDDWSKNIESWREYPGEREGTMTASKSRGSADRAREYARRGQHRLQNTLSQNPVAIGLAALAAGIVVGLVLPRTEVENEYMGETRDAVLEKARTVAQQTASQMTGSDNPKS